MKLSNSPVSDQKLEEAMRAAGKRAQASAAPVIAARTCAKLRISDVFGDPKRFDDVSKTPKKPK